MAFLFADSFDHYATADLLTKWTTSVATAGGSISVQAAAGRRASASFRTNGAGTEASMTKSLAASGATAVVGMAMNWSTTLPTPYSHPFLAIVQGGTPQITCLCLTDGRIEVRRGAWNGTVLGTTASPVFTSATYAYIELKVLIDPSAGTVGLRANGASALSLTGQNTRNTGVSGWDALSIGFMSNFGNPGKQLDLDDLYLLDGSGSAPLNDFLGDVRVDPRYPTGAGSNTGWTPNTGANWDAVNDTAPDGDTTYVSAASSPLTDTYATQDAPVAGATLYAVQLCIDAKKSDSGACTLAPVIRHSGTDYAGTTFNPGTSYAYGIIPYGLNPGTGTGWTESAFNAAEFGVRRVS